MPPTPDEVIELVRRWVDRATDNHVDRAGARLAAMLRDPTGLLFTVGFVDRVIRPESPRVAARNLSGLARHQPRFLPAYLRAALLAGAGGARVAPERVIPLVERTLREMVGHLLLDARQEHLGPAIAQLRADGTRLNLNLLGEAVLGRHEADRRLEGTHRLLVRDDVDYVSIKVSATVPPHSPWAFEETVAEVCQRLLPLFHAAAAGSPPKFINLDMEEYHDLDLTIAVFTRLLDRRELLGIEAGIVLQAYLPDAMAAMIDLQDWATERRARGGAPIKVRLVKGANLPMERVDAAVHRWPQATWSTKRETDTNYMRVLTYALDLERTDSVRIGVASHNLFEIAYAWLLALEQDVADAVEFEMLLGMARGHAISVRDTVGPLRLYTPVVNPEEFDVAIAYLVRRLDEAASYENFLSAAYGMAEDERLFDRECDRFLDALQALDYWVPNPKRTQNRTLDPGPVSENRRAFANVADTDPSAEANRAWAYGVIRRIPISELGVELVQEHTLTSEVELDAVLTSASNASGEWGGSPAAERAALLRSSALELERRRGELIEVMGAECGKTFDQSDPEISEAIDFANYYAELAEQLDHLDGAAALPVRVTLVTPPWNFPVSIPAGSTLGPLAAGSAVVMKPAPQAPRCAAVLVEALWAAGIPREVLQLVNVDEAALGRQLVSDPRIDRVILTGAFETAERFRAFRNDLPLLAETSGKNAIVVTESADLELAARDIVASAFSNAGQKCSAASLAILVGSVADSPRFHRQLIDGASSLKVAYPDDPTAQIGPLIEPASGKLEDALTTLAPGESWLVVPHAVDDHGRLWSPGIKTGLRRGSPGHLVEYFGPVLGLIAARDLDEAIAIQNEVEYGLTAGLQSLDRAEIETWLDRVEAGNLYVNRGITGAIVRRQPFGGWKKSAVGPGAKAGGPNYLLALSDWVSRASESAAPLGPLAERALEAARQAGLEVGRLERALRSDAAALAGEFGAARDVSQLGVERNLFRYLSFPGVEIREAHGELLPLVRVAAAAALAETVGRRRDRWDERVSVSVGEPLPTPVSMLIASYGFAVRVESEPDWLASLRDRPGGGRVRVVGSALGASASAVHEASGGRPDVTIYDRPVTESGRLEMLPFVREQAISITAHRFGTPDPIAEGLP